MKLDPLGRLVYHGGPAVKKNSQQVIFRGRKPMIVPGKDYANAKRSAGIEIASQWRGRGPVGSKDSPLRLCCRFYLPARSKPDFDNLYTACLDILMECGVISNDYWVLSPLPESERLRDIDNPRTEVEIYAQTDYAWPL